ncbi:cell wall metabolism sensor histidine kinase WalK [Metabacillus litoralis]|uniref:sensor histidine kinase n=1 Tax=Metabacillus litoralis TaxID=152268 RepID=UPI00203AA9D2|nr:ATP-binding protein [Metabacillus litoralis]MCM3161252.1 ATP-binding protein [Metabacillus litoralis]
MKTQQSLTVKYSLLILLFLLLFITILYAIVYVWSTTAEKNELREMALQEEDIIEQLLSFNNGPNTRIDESQFMSVNSNQLFFYVVNNRGELILQNEQLSLLKGKFLPLINDWHPNDEQIKTEAVNIDEKFIRESRGRDKEEFSAYTPKEQNLKVMMIAMPIYDRNQLVGYLYIGQNITDLSDLLRGLIIILGITALIFSGIAFYFSRVMSRRAMVPISTAFRRQQEFVADASHELRTPLSVMMSSLDILEMEDDQRNNMSSRMIGNLKDEVKRMTGLVGDLLLLARSDTDDPHAISFEVFDIQPVADRTVQAFEPHALEKNIKLEFEGVSSLTIFGNKERITQLLYILLDNAIKYSQQNGRVQLSISSEKDSAVISVSDDGIGMDEKELPHIFERFYRVDKARTRQHGGHGLGLSIAKWIVDLHNGKISLISKLNDGSTFIVKLPLKSSM